MILVCVGASEFKFDRFLKIIDELCEDNIIDGNDVIAQIGNTSYCPKNYNFFNLISNAEFEKYVQDSDFIITHAGTGSVVPAIKLGKKVIIFPRLSEYNEHQDNHQIELAECFTKNGYALSANNKEELIKCIKAIDKFKPKFFVSNKDLFNNFIIDYINDFV